MYFNTEIKDTVLLARTRRTQCANRKIEANARDLVLQVFLPHHSHFPPQINHVGYFETNLKK